MSNTTYRFFVEKLGGSDLEEFIGNEGELFYDPVGQSLRISDGTSITKEDYKKYNYPVNGWNWYDSIEAAYVSQGKTLPNKIINRPKSIIPKELNELINK
jgi:hypothetical protein